MSLRFRRSIRILPGVRINLSRSGLSTSIGARGASMTIGPRGTYTNVGIPGTGISYHSRVGGARSSSARSSGSRSSRRRLSDVERAAGREAALEEHAEAEARCKALASVLRHRVRAPFDWDAFVAPGGPFTPRPFVAPPPSFTEASAKRVAAETVGVVPWLVLLVIGVIAATNTRAWPARIAGIIALVVAVVGLALVPHRRATFAKRWLAERQRAHDADVERARVEHEETERRRAADWHESAAVRERLRMAVASGDAEPLAQLLEAELSNEELPVPLEFDVEFTGVSEVGVDLVLPRLDVVPAERTRITKSGKLSHRRMAQRDRKALYEALCCGLALRLAYEAFRVLPMLERVSLKGTASGVDPATGHERTFVALRLSARRADLAALELDGVEPLAALEHLGGAFGCDRHCVLEPVE